jgi:hypothetical protein
MEPTLQIALDTKTRLTAILAHHTTGSLSRTQWQGIAETGFVPSGTLTYLTSGEFNDFLALGWLNAYTPMRLSPLTTGGQPALETL